MTSNTLIDGPSDAARTARKPNDSAALRLTTNLAPTHSTGIWAAVGLTMALAPTATATDSKPMRPTFDPGVPLAYYRQPGDGLRLTCLDCMGHRDTALEPVIRRLEVRGLGDANTGIKAVAGFVTAPCRSFGGSRFETSPCFQQGQGRGLVGVGERCWAPAYCTPVEPAGDALISLFRCGDPGAV